MFKLQQNWSSLETIDPVIKFMQPSNISNNYPVLVWRSTVEMFFECSLDNMAYQACGKGKGGTWTGDNIPDGAHVFMVRGTDRNGNIIDEIAFEWTVSRGIMHRNVSRYNSIHMFSPIYYGSSLVG